jgi:transposase
MVFETDRATVYQIRAQHRNEEVRELVPSDYPGTLVTDRGKSYEAEELYTVRQQKCLSHLLRNVAEVVTAKSGSARTFGLRLDELLHAALELGKDCHSPTFDLVVAELDEELAWHLRDRVLKDPDNQRILDGIGLQHDKDRILQFLHQSGVEPTNNRSERVLRPAVIARKVSQCSKNESGASAFSAFVSVARNALKNRSPSLTAFFRTLFSHSPQAPP